MKNVFSALLQPLRVAVLVPCAVAAAAAAASALPFLGPGAVGSIAHAAPPRPHVSHHRTTAAANAAATAYTLVDLGSPSELGGYDYTSPTAFNNAGQVIGTAGDQLPDGFSDQDCYYYTSKAYAPKTGAFVNLTLGTTQSECTPTSIGAPNASSRVSFVGSLTTEFVDNPVAFSGQATGAKAPYMYFSAYDGSVLGGVDAAGEAVGQASYLFSYTSAYSPGGGWTFTPSYEPTVWVQPGAGAGLALAQPQCTNGRQYCALELWASQQCPFGGCTINDAGLLLAEDRNNGMVMTFTAGNPASGKDLAMGPSADIANVFLNDSGQIAYTVFHPSNSTYTSRIYTLAAGKAYTIPAIPKNSCASYIVDSFNNVGQVLGYTSNCSVASDVVYFIWDAMHGIRSINAQVPAGETLVGINDNGQILAAGYVGQNDSWLILNPPGGPALR